MCSTIERISIVSSNAANLSTLLNVADEKDFLQNYVSPEVFEELMAGDSNMARIRILCEKMIQEILLGNTKMYDALCQYFLEKSEAYKCMHLRFTAVDSTNSGSTSTNNELLLLQEKVKRLTQELLHLRQSISSDTCQLEAIHIEGLLGMKSDANEDQISMNALEVRKIKQEAVVDQPFSMGLFLAPSRMDIKPNLEEEAGVADVPDLNDFMEDAEYVEDGPGQITENDCDELSDSVVKTPYLCEHCGKQFRWKSSLVKHTSVHTGEKAFACEYCGKLFSSKIHMVQHVRIHTGEKPFACEHCGKRFNVMSNLAQHVRIHTGEKRFGCETCGKSFVQKSNLRAHMRVHTKKKPVVCKTGRKAFRSKSTLSKPL